MEKEQKVLEGKVPRRGRPPKKQQELESKPAEELASNPDAPKHKPRGKVKNVDAKGKGDVEKKGPTSKKRAMSQQPLPMQTPLKLSKLAKSLATPYKSPRSDAASAGSAPLAAPALTAAQLKRAEKAKLGLQKLLDNLGSQNIEDASVPGPGFPKLSYTAVSGIGTCNIGVYLYTESFYVYRNAKIPEKIAACTGLKARCGVCVLGF